MKIRTRRTLLLAIAATCLLTSSNVRAELFVVRVGDGAAALSNASTAAFVQRFNDDGSVSANPTINLPIAASGLNQPLTISGTASSEGFIAKSTDGLSLTMVGYQSAPGVAGIVSTTSLATPRVVAKINIASGAIDTTTALTDAYSGNNIRSAVTDGTNIWVSGTVGTTGGTRVTTLGATTSTQVSTSPTNTRVVDIANGNLYTSSGAANFTAISQVGTGLPTSGATTTVLPGFPTASRSPYDFWFKDANTLYVADDGSAANSGGIQKWVFDSGPSTWSLAYTLLNNGTTTTAVRGLTGKIDGADTVLFATTTQASANNLLKIIDSGASATATTLATAAVNTVFRGVEFVSSGVTPPTNNADFNNDAIVDGSDFVIWQKGLGQTGVPNNDKSTGDANGDHVVNGADLGIWQTKFGGPPTVAAAGAVPEPASVGLGLVALLGLARIRRGAKNS